MQSYLYKKAIYFFAYISGVIQLCKGFWVFGREWIRKFFLLFFQQGEYNFKLLDICITMVISSHFELFNLVLFIYPA